MSEPVAATIYATQLSSLQEGFPLWDPSPGSQPAVEIADVGYVEYGAWTRLFNASKPPDDSTNNLGMPDEYEQLDVGGIRERSCLPARVPIRSDHVEQRDLGIDLSGGPGVPIQGGGGFHFKCSKEQGAVLLLGDDADRRDALRKEDFARLIMKQSTNWLNFANKVQGRGIMLDDLVLVTGYDRTSSWACAAFARESSEAGVSFSVGQPGVAGGSISMSWLSQTSSSVATRSGSSGIEGTGPRYPVLTGSSNAAESVPDAGALHITDTGTSDLTITSPRNQCVFLRGYKVCDRKTWDARRILRRKKKYDGFERVPYKRKDDTDDSGSGPSKRPGLRPGQGTSHVSHGGGSLQAGTVSGSAPGGTHDEESGLSPGSSDSFDSESFGSGPSDEDLHLHMLLNQYKDPTLLGLVIDYILERSTVDMAIAHDDDLVSTGLLHGTVLSTTDFETRIREMSPEVYVDGQVAMLETTYRVLFSNETFARPGTVESRLAPRLFSPTKGKQRHDPEPPRKQPRVGTKTSFPSLLRARKSEPSPAAPVPIPLGEEPPSDLPLEGLIKALTPPSILSLPHARALLAVFQSETPRLELLMPVLSHLCAPHVSNPLLATGIEIISEYASSQTRPLSGIERASLFALLRSSDHGWTTDTWAPRVKCLSKLTQAGSNVAGYEAAFLQYTTACLSSTLEELLSDEAIDRTSRENYLVMISCIMRETFTKNVSAYTEQDLYNVLLFFEGFVQSFLDSCLPQGWSETAQISYSSGLSSLGVHHRNASSLSSAGPASHPDSRSSPPPDRLSRLDRTVLPIFLYISFLDMQHAQVSPAHLGSVVSLLARSIAVHLSPLPRPSAWHISQHKPRPSEESALNKLFELLAGAHADIVAGHMKHLMTSAHPQEALGAFRAVRAVLRNASESRMALLSIRHIKHDDGDPIGKLVDTEAYAGALERANNEGLEVPSLTVHRLISPAQKAVRHWVVHLDAEKMLEEALGMVNDILEEASDRDEKFDTEDYSSITVDEGCFVGTILSEAVNYMRIRPGNTTFLPVDKVSPLKVPFLPIDAPSMASSPLLVTLCTLLNLPSSTPMTPSLPSILLSIAPNLTDAQTTAIPQAMHSLGLLTPTSLSWLENISELFTKLVNRERPITTQELFNVIEAIYEDLTNVPAYRRTLGYRVFQLVEEVLDKEGHGDGPGIDSDESWTRLCAKELVLRIQESGDNLDLAENKGDESEGDDEALAQRIIDLFVRQVSASCQCWSLGDKDSAMPPHPPVSQEKETIPPLFPSRSKAPGLGSEALRPLEMDVPQHQMPSNPAPPPPALTLPSPSPSMGRNRESETPPSPAEIDSETKGDNCRHVCAVVALVNTFQDFSFGVARQPAYSVRLFNVLLSILKAAECPVARIVVLQLLMRLRTDRDHRLYILDNLDKEIDSLAMLVDRSSATSHEIPEDAEQDHARSTSRGLRPGSPRNSTGRRSGSGPDPAARDPAGRTPQSRSKYRRRLWMVPETLPFEIIMSKPSSHGVTTYGANASSEQEEVEHLLPISDYVLVLVNILRFETDWEILSYVLCHLPIQLANKHLFCGPKTKMAIVALLITLCTLTLKDKLANAAVEKMPEALWLRDVQDLAFHALAVLIGYKAIFDERKHHYMLVDAFMTGLSSRSSTIKFCLNALSICCYELPSPMTKNLPHIMEKLSSIMTNAEMAVHILDFVSIVGSSPSLYSNFREQEFEMVFAVAVSYIQHHNNPQTKPSGRKSLAYSQYALFVAYYNIYIWFLAVPLPDRPTHLQFLSRRLMLANEAMGVVDEATEVCFDWLARYTYATADPMPNHSLLGDIVMNPPRQGIDDPVEGLSDQKMWLWGNSLVTIRTLPKRGWIEVNSVRPSGETRFLCKLENFVRDDFSDLDSEMPTDPVLMVSNRNPDLEGDQVGAHTSERAMKVARNIFFPPAEHEQERPDIAPDHSRSQSTPSQRQKDVSIDPSFFALQLSQYPDLSGPTSRSHLVPPSSRLDALLRTLKHTPVIDIHRIAILYVGPGQTEEKEILGNRHGSPAYTRFLEGIGRLIRVRGQRDVYTGNLVPETDGEYAYAWWDDILQILYDVPTLMPNLSEDPGFAYKKRHVGNDKMRIVWNDSGLPYEHRTISSAFNFVNVVIEPHSMGTVAAFSDDKYEHEVFKVTMQRIEGMPTFGPIGDYKLVSAENLAPLLRQVSLLADIFLGICDDGNSTHENVTNWRRRLQCIKTFRSHMESEGPLPELEDDPQARGGLQNVWDFTRFF